MRTKISIRIILLSLVILFLFSISSCRQSPRSTVLTLPSLKLGSFVQERIDLNGDGKDENVTLEKTSEGARIQVNEAFEEFEFLADEFMDTSMTVSVKVMKGSDNQKYLLFSYNLPKVGKGFGNDYRFLLMSYANGSLVNIWDGNLSDMNHRYANNLFSIAFQKESISITEDISDKVNELNSMQERFAPLTVEEILNAPILNTYYDIGVMDYDDDGNDEIITASEFRESSLISYISSAYLVWDVDSGNVLLHSGILTEVLPQYKNNQDSVAFSELIRNGSITKDQVSKWDADNEFGYQKRMNELIDSGFLKDNGEKIRIG